MSNISLAQTSTTNSTDSNFLTYEDTAKGFKIQYPSDWRKPDLPSTYPIVAFVSPAQSATDNFFENLVITVAPLPTQNITLDQASQGLIEELGLSPEFDVISSPKETMLGRVPAYNMTHTDVRADENDPSLLLKIMFLMTWTVKDGKLYTVMYGGTENQFNYSINKAQKMIDSFEFLPSRQISTSEGPQRTPDNATMSHFSI
jgi:hypothetical protein